MNRPDEIDAAKDRAVVEALATDLAMALGAMRTVQILAIANAIEQAFLIGIQRGGEIALQAIEDITGNASEVMKN